MDNINHPKHYTQTPVECIDVIEMLQLGFHLGCALKYIWRYRVKGNPLEDLKKARWYLDRKIQRMEVRQKELEQYYLQQTEGELE